MTASSITANQPNNSRDVIVHYYGKFNKREVVIARWVDGQWEDRHCNTFDHIPEDAIWSEMLLMQHSTS
jgi:hypothetical protein